MDYVIKKKNLYDFSKDVYIIREKGKFLVYDFKHQLISVSKVIKGSMFGRICGNCLYYWIFPTKAITKWNFIDDTYDKIKFTKVSKPEIESLELVGNNLAILYSYSKNIEADKWKRVTVLAMLENDELVEEKVIQRNKIGMILENEYESDYIQELIVNNNKLMLKKLKNIDSNNKQISYFILTDDNGKELQRIRCDNQNIYKISDNGKYSFFATVDYHKNASIYVYDFSSFNMIDELNFIQEGFYCMIVYFFEYAGADYILFQANPSFELEEVWHTHIYSIKEKKIIKTFEYSIAIESLADKNLLIIQTPKKKKVIFHHY